MKRKSLTHAVRLLCVLALSMSMTTAAFDADPSESTQPSPSYPAAVTRSEDGSEISKMYDLGPEDNPGGISWSDFEQEGYHYTLTDLRKQELPTNESRQYTETVTATRTYPGLANQDTQYIPKTIQDSGNSLTL